MINSDKSAFPVSLANKSLSKGITKREYFAAQALQGLLANQYQCPRDPDDFQEIAEKSIAAADALLEELGND